MNQSSAFAEFDQNLNLDPSEREAAQSLHNEVTQYLESRGLIVGAFLQGSFARKTMLAPLHDVDKVVLLPLEQEASLSSMWGGPDTVMTGLQGALAELYPGAWFDHKRHALEVNIPGYQFHFDMVPAFEIPGSPDGDVRIANRDATTLDDQWRWSNPRRLIQTVEARNLASGGRFIHWVRMGKAMTARKIPDLPGLHTEAVCFAVNTSPMDDARACLRLFEAGSDLLGGAYTDPTGADNLSARLDEGIRLRAQAAFQEAARSASEALDYATAGDHDNACRVWAAIFGEDFPVPAMQSPREVLAGTFAGGGVTSVGTFTPTAAARQVARPTRSWAPGRR